MVSELTGYKYKDNDDTISNIDNPID